MKEGLGDRSLVFKVSEWSLDVQQALEQELEERTPALCREGLALQGQDKPHELIKSPLQAHHGDSNS